MIGFVWDVCDLGTRRIHEQFVLMSVALLQRSVDSRIYAEKSSFSPSNFRLTSRDHLVETADIDGGESLHFFDQRYFSDRTSLTFDYFVSQFNS